MVFNGSMQALGVCGEGSNPSVLTTNTEAGAFKQVRLLHPRKKGETNGTDHKGVLRRMP